MMRPTPRAVIVFGAGIPISLVFALLVERLWPLGLGYLALAILLTGLDALLAPRSGSLSALVRAPELLYAGDRDALTISLHSSDARQPVPIEMVCDVSSELERPDKLSLMLSPSETAEPTIPLVPLRRGTASIERLWLRWKGPLGLMVRHRVQPLNLEIPIVPNVRAVRTVALRLTTMDAPFGIKTQKQQGDGSEFDALRDYVPGLDRRSIDWKHSARHRSLVCKEFRTERNHEIILAFDTGHLMSEPMVGIPKLDHAINAGLMLTYMSLRGGDKVGLFGFDAMVRHATAPVGGMQNFWRLQQASSRLSYCQDETNFTLGLTDLLSRLNRRSLVILMTEFVDTVTAELMVDNLQRLSNRHLVIFVTLQDRALSGTVDVDPIVFGDVARAVIADEFVRDRAIVQEKLRRLGVHCIDAPAEAISMELVNRYLLIKRQDLI